MGTRLMRKDQMNLIKEKNHIHHHHKSQTLPPSPTHSFSSSSSSDFEFTISLSPRKSSNTLCPADELFYKGQLLPLHLSPRLSMVRTLLLPSSTSSYSSSETTTSRDSTGSSSNESRDSTSSFASDLVLLADQSCDSSRPSSVAEDNNDEPFKSFKRFNNNNNKYVSVPSNDAVSKKKYFSLSRFSSVFRKEPKVIQKDNTIPDHHHNNSNNAVGAGSNNNSVKPKRISTTAKEVISKYLKKVKPLYEKLSQKQQQKMGGGGGGGLGIMTTTASTTKISEKCSTTTRNNSKDRGGNNHGLISHSFSGNLRYPRRRGCVSSCPSSMRSSPSHSGVLSRTTGLTGSGSAVGGNSRTSSYGDRSSMEELQSAIQGAIAHCKNSLVQSRSTTMVSNEI